MKRRVGLYIKDIVEYMERAEEHVKVLSHEQFLNDRKTCDAVIRCIEVMGEATKNIPDDIRSKYPSIPWRDIAGMSDKPITGYFIVDSEEVWLAVKEDIPKLKPLIRDVLEDLEKMG